MDNRLNIIEQKVDLIIDELNFIKDSIKLVEKHNYEIEIKIDTFTNNLGDINKSCNNMDKHINFVEKTYDNLKYPLNIFKNKIESVFGRNTEIEHKPDDII